MRDTVILHRQQLGPPPGITNLHLAPSMGTSPLILMMLLSLLLCWNACRADAQPVHPKPKTIIVEPSLGIYSIDLNVGDTLLLSLKSNPSTAYAWRPMLHSDRILTQSGPPRFDPIGTQKFGTSQRETIAYRARKAGVTIIDITYERAWESTDAARHAYHLAITVH
jgi:predicted secreted protein